MKRRYERGTRNCHRKSFRKFWTIRASYMYRKCLSKDEFFTTLMKLKLYSFFTDLSQHFGICFVVFALSFLIHRHVVRGDLK